MKEDVQREGNTDKESVLEQLRMKNFKQNL